MVAVPGDSDTGLLASLNKSCTLLNLDFLAIDGDLDLGGDSWCGCECSPGCNIDKASSCGLQAP